MSIVKNIPYGNEIGDRLWMWGTTAIFCALLHKTEGYNLPYDKRIDMADACVMGILDAS